MSLGGDADDGTDPLSQAVNELSATSGTLFVDRRRQQRRQRPVDRHRARRGRRRAHRRRGRRRRRDGRASPAAARASGDGAAQAGASSLPASTSPPPAPPGPSSATRSSTTAYTTHRAAPRWPRRTWPALAAILEQQHPSWDGEQLKAAIANSTVPVADATGFDAGTGRVDALRGHPADRALGPRVRRARLLSVAAVSTSRRRATTLTYTNHGGAARRRSPSPSPRRTGRGSPRSASHSLPRRLTIPACSEGLSIEVLLDPSLPGRVVLRRRDRLQPPGRWSVIPPSASASKASITT